MIPDIWIYIVVFYSVIHIDMVKLFLPSLFKIRPLFVANF